MGLYLSSASFQKGNTFWERLTSESLPTKKRVIFRQVFKFQEAQTDRICDIGKTSFFVKLHDKSKNMSLNKSQNLASCIGSDLLLQTDTTLQSFQLEIRNRE